MMLIGEGRNEMTTSHEDRAAVFDETSADHRRRTRRQDRHQAHLVVATRDDEHIDDLPASRSTHDVCRTSTAPHHDAAPGRRRGVKVWKTPFWTRRALLHAAQNRELRRVADQA
jgi:hypothetical protein